MWIYLKFSIFVLLSLIYSTNAIELSNSTALMVPDEVFHGVPVFYKSNIDLHMDNRQKRDHIHRILEPLASKLFCFFFD